MMRRRWVLLLPCLAVLACADGWDDFSNNLASDLAPILALLGEQVTKQFLSESTSWLDNFIFAMVPLGILTAVVSAIRVCGGSSLRAFIGRAQEGGGVAEAELCSSTSRDVCELYHNGSIVRVFGRPKILEIVHDPTDALFYDEDDKTANFGIYSFQEYIGDPPKGSAWTEDGKPVQGSREADDDVEAARDGQKPPSSAKDEIRFALNPNLSLNIGIKKHPRWMWLAAGLGLSLQCWIIAYAALVKYRWRWKKNDRVTPDWALGLMAAGTVAQCSGMYLCAMLVERSTKERVFKRKATGQGDPMLRVVQPGNQVIGDQTFDPFSFATDPKEPLEEYTTSWKDTQKRTPEWKVYCSVVLTLVGFAAQFTGLRYMHSSVSVTQLGAILLMSLARSMLRTERLKKEENRLQDRPDEVEGSELDWLAIQIGGDGDYDPKNSALLWSVVADAERKSSTRDMEGPGHGKAEVASGAKPNVVTESRVMKERNKTTSSVESIEMISNAGNPQNTDAVNVTDKCDKPIDQIHILRSASHSTASDRMIKAGHMNWLKHTDCRKDPKQHICPATLFHYRARLAQLTSQSKPSRAGRSNVWGDQLVRARPPARQLKKAIEATADILFAHGMVKEVYQAAQHFTWSLSSHNRVESRFGNQAANGQPTANTEESDQTIAAGFSHCQDTEAEQSRPPQTHQQSQSETSCEIHLSLIRPVKGKTLSSWQADQHALEAVIGLSAWSMISHPIKETQDNFGLTISEAAGVPNGRILAAAKNAKDLQRAKVDLELWIGDFLVQTTERRLASNLSPYHKGPSVVWQDDEADFKVLAAKSVGPQLRLFGWETTKGVRHDVDLNNTELLTLISTFPVSDSSNNPLPTLCAQDIYQSFLCSITAIMDSVGPKGAAGLGIERFVLKNDVISKLIDCFEESGLGSRQEASLVVISALRSRSKLSSPIESLEVLLRQAESHKKERQYETAEALLRWAYHHVEGYMECSSARAEIVLRLCELYRSLLCGPEAFFAQDGLDSLRFAMERLIEQNDEDSKQVIEVIQRYADLSEREPCRRPPSAKDIIKAIFDHKRDETLWLLSQQGIKVSKPDQNGRTVLSYAAERGWTEVVQAALGVGSKINGPDLIGRTAISWASEFGEPTMVKLLISQQASPTLPDHFGRTPLSYAASRGDRAVVDVLLKDIRVETLACDLENKSPLFWASEKGHVEVVTTLLRRRMDRAVIDEQTVGNGLTPLSVALVKNHLEVAELLVAKGASYRHIRIEGLYPLDWAVDCGRWSIVEFLLKCSNKAPEYKVVLERPKTSVVLLLRRNGVVISPASLRSPLLPTTRDGITVAQHDADGNVTKVTEESAPLFLSKGYRLEAYTVCGDEVHTMGTNRPTRDLGGTFDLLARCFGDKFRVTKELLAAALANPECDAFLLKKMVKLGIGSTAVIALIQCSYQCSYLNLSIRDEPTILQELHDSYENALPMRPDVWEAVAWVEDVGKAGKFLELLLHGLKICPDQIPESFIEALLGRDSEAAEQSSIRVMMEMLGERAHGAVRLTPRAWKRAAAGSDNWILAFLRRNWSDSMPKEIQDELSWIEKLRVALRPNSNVPLTKHIEQGLEQYAESGKDYVLLLLATAVRGRMLKATRILAQWPGLDINAPVLPRRRPVLFAARSREIEQVLIDAGAHQDFEDLFGEIYKSYRERHPVSNP